MFHVSLLRRALLLGMVVENQLPHCTDDLAVPVEILQTRWHRKNNTMCEQVKIRWSNSATLGTTWEDKDNIKARFPHSEAWGQASSQEEGDVSDPDTQDPLGSHSTSNDTAQRPSRLRRPNMRVHGPE